MPSLRLNASLLLCFLCHGRAEEDGSCAADGNGCGPKLAIYPDCQHSCNDPEYIGAGSGNRQRTWPLCPRGPGGCEDCEDHWDKCATSAQALTGYGCEDNPAFMITVCARSCNTCHLRDWKTRCSQFDEYPESIQKGDINATMEWILSLANVKTEVISRDPWILLFPNFLSEEEIQYFASKEARGMEWEAAANLGDLDEHGRHTAIVSSSRKTSVAWCGPNCANHPITRQVRRRFSELIRISPVYFEGMQFLKYEVGDYYDKHYDSSRSEHGGKHRVYTFLLYLNDVDSGGETEFPAIDIRIKPRRGSVVLWPSVENHDPWTSDERAFHAALPLKAGVKYSINTWIHMGPFLLAHSIGCSASPIKYKE